MCEPQKNQISSEEQKKAEAKKAVYEKIAECRRRQ